MIILKIILFIFFIFLLYPIIDCLVNIDYTNHGSITTDDEIEYEKTKQSHLERKKQEESERLD